MSRLPRASRRSRFPVADQGALTYSVGPDTVPEPFRRDPLPGVAGTSLSTADATRAAPGETSVRYPNNCHPDNECWWDCSRGADE